MKELWLKRYTICSITLAVIGFALILCIPLVNLEGTTGQKIGAYIIAALFWLSIIAQVFVVRWSTRERRWLERRGYRSKTIREAPIGVCSFFKNFEARVIDVIMFVSFIAVVIELWTRVKTGWLIMASVSVLYLSFNLHCILNGRNYRYLKAFISSKKEHERDE